MKTKIFCLLLPAAVLLFTSCGEPQAAVSSAVQTTATEDPYAQYGDDVEFIDAPMTAPAIIDGDELPEDETSAPEVYQEAPPDMPES